MENMTKYRRTIKKVNLRKFLTRMSVIVITLVVIGAALFEYMQTINAGVSSKPDVLVWRFRGAANAANTSAAVISTALATNYNVTITDTMPTLDEANSYDAVILSTGKTMFTTVLTDQEKDFLNQYLNGSGNRGHLIIEGEQLVNGHTAAAHNAFRSGVLKIRSYSNTATNSSIQIVNNRHPVTSNLSRSFFSYSTSQAMRAVNPLATRLGQWQSGNNPDTVLSIWEGARRKRLVFMGFSLASWSGGTTRDDLIRNSVKWVTDFTEVTLENKAPANAAPGETGIKMGFLTFATYPNASNNNINTVSSFSVTQVGNASINSIGTLRIYNANSSGEPLGPPLASTVFANGKATFKYMNLQVRADVDRYCVITMDVNNVADEGHTIKLKLADTLGWSTKEGGRVKVNGGDETGVTTINNITPPGVPSQVYTTNLMTGTSLRVAWRPRTEWDMAGYKIYRAEDSGSGIGAYSYLTSTTQPYYEDTGLTEFNRYYYKITAYDIANNESDKGREAIGIPNRRPNATSGLVANNPGTGHKVDLTWDALTGEPLDPFNGNTPDLLGYNLYAATTTSSVYGKVNENPITSTSYTHLGVKDGVKYFYKVVPVDRYGLEATMLSSSVSVTPSDSTPPIVVSTYPIEGQDYVERNTTIQVKLDDLLDTSGDISSWLTVERKNADDTYTAVSGKVYYNPGRYELTFEADNLFEGVGSYRATLKGGPGGVKSFATPPYLAEDKVWTFGTLLSPHEDFQNNTTLCGYCHSAHSATGSNIIKQPNILDLCFTCHDGTGSSYDVKAGKYNNGEKSVPLIAGGYDTSLGSTSTHFTDIANTVYGSPGYVMPINCNTCHNPHGSSNYRNLRTTINGMPTTVKAVAYGPAFSQKTASGYEVVSYESGWEQFCGTCHFEYQTYHSVTTITGEENWRHRTGVPLTGGGTDGRWQVRYDGNGLYTTLPTLGTPTGANITSYDIETGGNLSGATYNYIITGVNSVGESAYGNIFQVPSVPAGSKVSLEWQRIENAYKYRIYRAPGAGNPISMDISQFKFLAEVPDYPNRFTDNLASPTDSSKSPPTVTNAKLTCITCHYVHGSPAIAENGEETRLRRYNNDGICQDCHKK